MRAEQKDDICNIFQLVDSYKWGTDRLSAHYHHRLWEAKKTWWNNKQRGVKHKVFNNQDNFTEKFGKLVYDKGSERQRAITINNLWASFVSLTHSHAEGLTFCLLLFLLLSPSSPHHSSTPKSFKLEYNSLAAFVYHVLPCRLAPSSKQLAQWQQTTGEHKRWLQA